MILIFFIIIAILLKKYLSKNYNMIILIHGGILHIKKDVSNSRFFGTNPMFWNSIPSFILNFWIKILYEKNQKNTWLIIKNMIIWIHEEIFHIIKKDVLNCRKLGTNPKR